MLSSSRVPLSEDLGIAWSSPEFVFTRIYSSAWARCQWIAYHASLHLTHGHFNACLAGLRWLFLALLLLFAGEVALVTIGCWAHVAPSVICARSAGTLGKGVKVNNRRDEQASMAESHQISDLFHHFSCFTFQSFFVCKFLRELMVSELRIWAATHFPLRYLWRAGTAVLRRQDAMLDQLVASIPRTITSHCDSQWTFFMAS